MAISNATLKRLFLGTGAVAVAVGLCQLPLFLRSEHQRKLVSLPIKERGLALLDDLGCSDCHQTGSPLRAPILPGLFGKTVTLQDGTTIVADEDYLRRSIIDPKAQIVQGYQATMPIYQGQLNREDIEAIIAAMK